MWKVLKKLHPLTFAYHRMMATWALIGVFSMTTRLSRFIYIYFKIEYPKNNVSLFDLLPKNHIRKKLGVFELIWGQIFENIIKQIFNPWNKL